MLLPLPRACCGSHRLLLWSPSPQRKHHLSRAREGEKGHHQSEHGKGKSRLEGSLCGPVIPEGDWAWKVKVEAGRDVVSLSVSGALERKQSGSGDCRSEAPQDAASWLQDVASWLQSMATG